MAIIHKTTTRRALAAEDLSEAEGLAIKKNAEGLVELATGAEDALGVVHVGGEPGDWVDYMLPGMPGIVGVRLAEEATPEDITEGTPLTVATGGVFTAATSGQVALALAAEDAREAGQLLEAILIAPTSAVSVIAKVSLAAPVETPVANAPDTAATTTSKKTTSTK